MNLQDTAIHILADYDNHRPGTVFAQPDLRLSMDEAYELQFKVAALREARGEKVAGYKIGCISRTMQQQLGINHPVFGQVWNSEIYKSGTQLRAQDYEKLAIEGELGVRIKEDIPSSEWLANNPDVISTQFTVIELHNYVFRGPESNRAAELVANNAIHAGVVIADEEKKSIEFNPDCILQVYQNTHCLGEGVADHLQNGTLDIVMAVSEHLERRGLQLKRNQIVLTGSPLPMWQVETNDRISVCGKGLAEVFCTITE